eukprot:1244907-Pleurochrysis_carterae.AAC.2
MAEDVTGWSAAERVKIGNYKRLTAVGPSSTVQNCRPDVLLCVSFGFTNAREAALKRPVCTWMDALKHTAWIMTKRSVQRWLPLPQVMACPAPMEFRGRLPPRRTPARRIRLLSWTARLRDHRSRRPTPHLPREESRLWHGACWPPVATHSVSVVD